MNPPQPRTAAPENPDRPTTMADIAAEVGVSRQLVGMAFRDKQGVGERTRQSIFEAAERLGYRPNTAAQTLRSTSTKLIGTVFRLEHSAALEIVGWLHGSAQNAGYTVTVSTASDQHDEVHAIRELTGYRCEAVVLIAPECATDAMRRAAGSTPVIIVGRDQGDGRFDAVRSQGESGMYGVIEHLTELGHRDIAYVHGSRMFEASARRSGYLKGMSARTLTPQIIEVDDEVTEEAGASGVRQILANAGSLPTAIACNNDQAAEGAIHELRRLGLLVPHEISVTGYDDSRLAQRSFIDLTTARQDPKAMAAAVIDTTVRRIVDNPSERIETFIEAPLVVRGSTSRPLPQQQISMP